MAEKCAFCSERDAVPTAVVNVQLQARPESGAGGEIITVPVPRCVECSRAHSPVRRYSVGGTILGLLVGLGGVHALSALRLPAWINLPLFVPLLLGIPLGMNRLGRWVGVRALPANTNYTSTIRSYPAVGRWLDGDHYDLL